MFELLKENLYIILIAYLLIMSIITYCFYVSDKKRAIRQDRRIPEKTLLILSLVGGAIGGYLAMLTVRHKTKHWYFTAVNLLGIAIHIAALVLMIVYFS